MAKFKREKMSVSFLCSMPLNLLFHFCLSILILFSVCCRLELYIHDYLVKKKMHATANILAREAGIQAQPYGPGTSSFLSLFSDPFFFFKISEFYYLMEDL